MPFRSAEALLPLTPIDFEILLALSDAELHGYGILQRVEARVQHVLPLRTGTLYRALARLSEAGLIETAAEPAAAGDERRRYYRITGTGRDVARAEAERLADQVEAARARRLLPGSRR